MHTDEDVRKLIAAAKRACTGTGGYGKGELNKALHPFREQRPRVGKAHYDPECSFLAIELTDAVKDALDKAGVEFK